jgi:hypothetical protein
MKLKNIQKKYISIFDELLTALYHNNSLIEYTSEKFFPGNNDSKPHSALLKIFYSNTKIVLNDILSTIKKQHENFYEPLSILLTEIDKQKNTKYTEKDIDKLIYDLEICRYEMSILRMITKAEIKYMNDNNKEDYKASISKINLVEADYKRFKNENK